MLLPDPKDKVFRRDSGEAQVAISMRPSPTAAIEGPLEQQIEETL
jgi:hypothetical protein